MHKLFVLLSIATVQTATAIILSPSITSDVCNGSTSTITVDGSDSVQINLPYGNTTVEDVFEFACSWNITFNTTDSNKQYFFELDVNSDNLPDGTFLTVSCPGKNYIRDCWSTSCASMMIVPCDEVTITFLFNTRFHAEGYSVQPNQQMLTQSDFQACDYKCPNDVITLSDHGDLHPITLFNTRNALCNKSVPCTVKIGAPTGYVIEYESVVTNSSYSSKIDYALYDTEQGNNIQKDCQPGQQSSCFPRTTTGQKGALTAHSEVIDSSVTITSLNDSGITFNVRAVPLGSDKLKGTQNCYCGQQNVDLSKMFQSPNYDTTGACANMECTYTLNTNDYSKLLKFHMLNDEISSSVSSPTTTLTAVSVGDGSANTVTFFTCESGYCPNSRHLSLSNKVQVTYKTGTVSPKAQNFEAGRWSYNVSVVDTPTCAQTTYDSSNLYSISSFSPLGPYYNQKCSISITATYDNNLYDNCYSSSVYQPVLSYTDFSTDCVEGLTIIIHDGVDISGNVVGTITGCSGQNVYVTSTTQNLFLVWQRTNADITRTATNVQISDTSVYSGSSDSCYSYGWIWYAVLIPVLCAIVFITIIYTIRYRRMRLMRRGVVHAQAPTAMYTIPSSNQQMYATPQAYPQQQMQYQPQMMSPTPPAYANLTTNPPSAATTNT